LDQLPESPLRKQRPETFPAWFDRAMFWNGGLDWHLHLLTKYGRNDTIFSKYFLEEFEKVL